MKKIIVVSALFASLCLSGCATSKYSDWTATGGSRADGVVKLSYETNGFEKPVLNDEQAIGVATDRCKSWGYMGGAKAFDGVFRHCISSGLGPCFAWTITRDYQCTIADSIRVSSAPSTTSAPAAPTAPSAPTTSGNNVSQSPTPTRVQKY
jgi:outer membrane lipoprotein SlyB